MKKKKIKINEKWKNAAYSEVYICSLASVIDTNMLSDLGGPKVFKGALSQLWLLQ